MGAPETSVEYRLLDGPVRLSLRMRALYRLWQEEPEEWAEYNRITTGGTKLGELDTARVLYVAYRCHCLDAGEDAEHGSFEAFLEAMPDDRPAMNEAFRKLLAPKKA